MGIFIDDPDTRADLCRRIEQRLTSRVEFTQQLRPIASVGPEALRVIIEVRQIDASRVGRAGCRGQYLRRAAGDPLATCQARHRSPESRKGKVAQLRLEP